MKMKMLFLCVVFLKFALFFSNSETDLLRFFCRIHCSEFHSIKETSSWHLEGHFEIAGV